MTLITVYCIRFEPLPIAWLCVPLLNCRRSTSILQSVSISKAFTSKLFFFFSIWLSKIYICVLCTMYNVQSNQFIQIEFQTHFIPMCKATHISESAQFSKCPSGAIQPIMNSEFFLYFRYVLFVLHGKWIIEQKSKWHNERANNNIDFKNFNLNCRYVRPHERPHLHSNIIIIIFQLRIGSNRTGERRLRNKISKGWIDFCFRHWIWVSSIDQIIKMNSIAISDMNECDGRSIIIGPSPKNSNPCGTGHSYTMFVLYFFSFLFRRIWDYSWRILNVIQNLTRHIIWYCTTMSRSRKLYMYTLCVHCTYIK